MSHYFKEFFNEIFNIILFFLSLLIVDKLFIPKKARWYILHSITNMIVTFITAQDVILVLSNPLVIYPRESFACDIIMALHIYHMVMFKNLQLIDWVHHIVMLIILSFTYFYTPAIYICNYLLFFLSGFPGGIDYIMLSLVKYNLMDKLEEKYFNSKINIWIRGPGIIIGTYILFLQHYHNLLGGSPIILVFSLIGLLWNAQYFTERIVSNYYHKLIQKKIKDNNYSL